MSVTRSNLVPSFIQSGRIIDVDPIAWTMTIRTEVGGQEFSNVPINSIYTHPFEGEGMHFMPEPGAYVWVARSSEGDARPFPLVFKALNDQAGSHKANRPSMNPGDFVFQTRDRNGMKIRRGGVVEIYSTPISRMFFLPQKNEILTFAENYRLETFPGSLNFKTFRPEENPDMQKGAQFSLSVKEFVDQPNPCVEIKAGTQISDNGTQVLDLRIWQDSTVDTTEEPLRESVSLTATRQGSVSLSTYRAAPATAQEDLEKSTSLDLGNTGDITLTSENSVEIFINESSEVKVNLLAGGGQFAVFETEANTEGVVLGKTFLTSLQSSLLEIQTALNGLGIPTPNTLSLLNDITVSIASAKGSGPLLSTRMRTE